MLQNLPILKSKYSDFRKIFWLIRDDFEDEIIKETLKSVINVKEIQVKMAKEECTVTSFLIWYGRRCDECFRFVQSLWLWRWRHQHRYCSFFETMEGLANAEKVMQDLYNDEVYQNIWRREKTNNYARFFWWNQRWWLFKANWEIYATKERLKVSEENDVKVIFFWR